MPLPPLIQNNIVSSNLLFVKSLAYVKFHKNLTLCIHIGLDNISQDKVNKIFLFYDEIEGEVLIL